MTSPLWQTSSARSRGPFSQRHAPGPTLHEEIARLLREDGNRWMTTYELASEINAAGRYRKRDGSAVTPFQVHGRTRNYENLFERDGSRVRLR